MGGKYTTSAECQTIRIAKSSDMDDWKAVLRPCAKVVNKLLIKEMFTTIPKGWYGGGKR